MLQRDGMVWRTGDPSFWVPSVAVPAPLPESLVLTDDELAAFRDSIKFADCVPQQLLTRTIIARNFEVC
jgi:ATP-dependent Lhr-like helicase